MTRLLRCLVALLFAGLPLMSHAIEEPDYQVTQQGDGFELRRYSPYVVAEVLLASTAEEAGGQAFPILAGYIFGKNKAKKTFAMTAPVTQMAAASVRLNMTAPVTQSTAPGGGMQVQFVLPKGVSLEAAPEPLDPRVNLRLVPSASWAVIRYSGTWSAANTQEHLDKLRAALAAAAIKTVGEPVLARYDAPFKPWFLRRNEIWLALP